LGILPNMNLVEASRRIERLEEEVEQLKKVVANHEATIVTLLRYTLSVPRMESRRLQHVEDRERPLSRLR
jgi:hypothetical protein